MECSFCAACTHQTAFAQRRFRQIAIAWGAGRAKFRLSFLPDAPNRMPQRTAARLGFAAFALASVTAAAAVASVRLGLLPYVQGWRLMIPATGLALAGAILGAVWVSR